MRSDEEWEALLGEEQRARWAAEQDCQHYREQVGELADDAGELTGRFDDLQTHLQRAEDAVKAAVGGGIYADFVDHVDAIVQMGLYIVDLRRQLAEAEACLDNASKHQAARALGLQAREHGEVREAVPYPEHTSEWRGWLIGWVKADQDARLAEVCREREAIALELSRSGDAIASLERRVAEAQDAREGAYGMAEHERQARLAAEQRRDELAKRLAEAERERDQYMLARNDSAEKAREAESQASAARVALREAEAGVAELRGFIQVLGAEACGSSEPFMLRAVIADSCGDILACDRGRAHLEEDARREALGRELAGMLNVLSPTPMVLELRDQARAAGWLQEEKVDA